MRQQRTEAAAIEAEIAQLRSLALDALRRRWRAMFGRTPPAALSKDLLGGMIAWRTQEQAFGGLDRESSGSWTVWRAMAARPGASSNPARCSFATIKVSATPSPSCPMGSTPPLSLDPPTMTMLPSADSATEGVDFPTAPGPTSFLSCVQ